MYMVFFKMWGTFLSVHKNINFIITFMNKK